MKTQLWKSTLKSKDTEEWIDLHFYRIIGYYLALFFRKIRITPNQITIASIFMGITAGICFHFQKISINLWGIFFLIFANVLDSSDGQLARMTNQKSEMGRILDGLCGVLWFTSIYMAIIFRSEEKLVLFWVLLSGFCHLKQTSMADYYRNLHLFFLYGEKISEIDTSKILAKKYDSINKKRRPFKKLAIFLYLYYTINQEKRTPQLQKLLHFIRIKYESNLPLWLKESFRTQSLPLLKYTNLISFNLRSYVLFICILTNLLNLYLIFEITIMNLLLFHMINSYERICLKINKSI